MLINGRPTITISRRDRGRPSIMAFRPTSKRAGPAPRLSLANRPSPTMDRASRTGSTSCDNSNSSRYSSSSNNSTSRYSSTSNSTRRPSRARPYREIIYSIPFLRITRRSRPTGFRLRKWSGTKSCWREGRRTARSSKRADLLWRRCPTPRPSTPTSIAPAPTGLNRLRTRPSNYGDRACLSSRLSHRRLTEKSWE